MWILGRSCGEPRLPLKIELPPGAYLAPCSYDAAQLAVLARFLCDAGPTVRDLAVMTWRQADVLEALGRTRGDGHRPHALWALHGDAGAPLPEGETELKSLTARRFPSMQPRWVIILDAEAPAASLGWLEAHMKMPLVSWLGRLLGDERHPLHAAAVDRIDVHALAAMTSDPLEMMEIVEKALEHRLTYAFPAGIPVETVVSGPVNVEEQDWSRSLRVAAAQRLASRVNKLLPEVRGDAVRVLLGLELSAERRAPALAALVRAGLVLSGASTSDRRLALARTVLDDEDDRVVFQDAVELSGEERKALDRGTPRRQMGMLGAAEISRGTARSDVGGSPVAPEDVPQQYVTLRQSAAARLAPAVALARFAEFLYQSTADPVQAAQLYEHAVASDPANAELLQSYATFLRYDRREIDRAQELYERAIAIDPKNVNALNNFANLLREDRREFDRAQELYERAIAIDPKNVNALNNFANLLRHVRRDLDRAQELYERAITVDPKNTNTFNDFANLMRAGRRDIDRAQELYERAIAIDPKNVNALNNFATFLHEDRRDLDRAQELYERAIAIDPKNVIALGNFATFLRLERRDIDRAQELYERATSIDPKNANILGNFATFLSEDRCDMNRAQNLYERAVVVDPKNANSLANLAHVLFLAGRRPAAIEWLREAIRQADTAPASLRSEIAFYRAVHIPEERDDALHELRALIAQGARSPVWNFRAHALLAEKVGDADAPLFFALADVLSGKADAATLAAFPRWTQASPLTDPHPTEH
jgi:Tfp pilus assembly protein PilF